MENFPQNMSCPNQINRSSSFQPHISVVLTSPFSFDKTFFKMTQSDSSDFKKISVEFHNEIYIITIMRSHIKNCIDRSTADELFSAFSFFDTDSRFKVAILSGDGPDFCAGADLKALSTGNGNRIDENVGPLGPTKMLLTKPVIAVVTGHAVAGGLELACWCDMRICDKTAIFGVYCRRRSFILFYLGFGVPLIDGGTVRLPRLIGHSRALDMIITGRSVDAIEAFQWGLANRLTENGEAMKEALTLAERICKFPQSALRNDRTSSYDGFGMDLKDALYNEFILGFKTLNTQEYLAGSKKFVSGEGKHGVFPVHAKL